MSPRKPNEQPVLELKNIHKSFGDRQILKGVSFNVYAGEERIDLAG